MEVARGRGVGDDISGYRPDWWSRARRGSKATCRASKQHARELTLILGLPELVHPKGPLPPYAHRVGPIVGDPPLERETPAWVDAVGRERPAILASVSTSWQGDAHLIGTLGQAAQAIGVDVVATVAAEHDLGPLPDNVRLTTFAPHAQLLTRVRVVACHAGYGTTTRAACRGVPLLLFPAGRDQFHVARGAVAAGLAIAMDSGADVASVRVALDRLLTEPRYRDAARSLAQSAKLYDGARAAADLIEAMPARG